MIKRYDFKHEDIGTRLEGYSKTRNCVCEWYILSGPNGAPTSVALAVNDHDSAAVNFVYGFLHFSAPLIVVPESRLLMKGPGRITACPELIKLLEHPDPVHAYLAVKPAKEKAYMPNVLTFSHSAPPEELYRPLSDIPIEWHK